MTKQIEALKNAFGTVDVCNVTFDNNKELIFEPPTDSDDFEWFKRLEKKHGKFTSIWIWFDDDPCCEPDYAISPSKVFDDSRVHDVLKPKEPILFRGTKRQVISYVLKNLAPKK